MKPAKKRKGAAWHCYWCDQEKDKPIRGKDRLGRSIVICPHCRGPV